MDYLISAQTRDQLIDLLERVADPGSPQWSGSGRDAANILPHLKAAPEFRTPAYLRDEPESADPVTAAKAEADRLGYDPATDTRRNG